MVAGYIRQAAANIAAGLTIRSTDHNAEYNQIQSAFDNTTGHDHSGSATGVGSKIPLTSAVTGILPIANGGTNSSTVLTAGSILYSDGTKITQDNANLFWDSTNHRLGIGTTTPSQSFHNAGNSLIGGVLTASTGIVVTTGGLTVSAGGINITGLSTVAALTASGVITPNAGIKGTTTNDNASASNVGEYTFAGGAGGPIVSLTPTDIVTLSLTAGDWQVWGTVAFTGGGAGFSASTVVGWITTTAATDPGGPNGGAYLQIVGTPTFNGANTWYLPIGQTRMSLAGTTTVRVGLTLGYSGATGAANGWIGARRVR